jgi:hypothetical protein
MNESKIYPADINIPRRPRFNDLDPEENKPITNLDFVSPINPGPTPSPSDTYNQFIKDDKMKTPT